MKSLKIVFLKYAFAPLALFLFALSSCQKSDDGFVEETLNLDGVTAEAQIIQTVERDKDVLELLRLLKENSYEIISAIRQENISVEDFKALYEAGDTDKIYDALKLDKKAIAATLEEISKYEDLLADRYANLEVPANNNPRTQDAFVTLGQVIDGTIKRGECKAIYSFFRCYLDTCPRNTELPRVVCYFDCYNKYCW